MDLFSVIIKKFFDNIFDNDNELSINLMTREHLPYLIAWICIIIWLNCYSMPIGYIREYGLSKMVPTSISSYFYIFTNIIFACILDIRKLLPYTKYSVFTALIGILTEIIFNNTPIAYVGIILGAFGVGCVIASAAYGFFMILNNKEKFYSVSLGILISKIILLFKVNFAVSSEGSKLFEVMQVVGFIPILICALFYKKDQSNKSIKPEVKERLKNYTALILALVVLTFNEFLAPTLWRFFIQIPTITINYYHAAGVFLGIIFVILLHQILHCNICYVLNISLAILILGFVTNILAYQWVKFSLLTALLYGVSYATGFISIYYMLGIIVKKYCRMTFYRIIILSIMLIYIFGFSLIFELKNINSQSVNLITMLLSIIVILIIFILNPLFTKTFFPMNGLMTNIVLMLLMKVD